MISCYENLGKLELKYGLLGEGLCRSFWVLIFISFRRLKYEGLRREGLRREVDEGFLSLFFK